jgi:hypothetical protein
VAKKHDFCSILQKIPLESNFANDMGMNLVPHGETAEDIVKEFANKILQQKTRFSQKSEGENREKHEKLFLQFLQFLRFSQTRYLSDYSEFYLRTTIKFKGLFQGDHIVQIFVYWVNVYLGK